MILCLFRSSDKIDDAEWKNPIDFGDCARHNFIQDTPINFIFDVAINIPGKTVSIDLGENRSIKINAGGHFEKKVESELARYATIRDLRASKMAAGSHFVKQNIDWSEIGEMQSKSDFWASKMAGGSILWKNEEKNIYNGPRWLVSSL